MQNSFFLSDDLSASAITTTTSTTDITEPDISDVAASAYTKTDKTGVIGFFATYIELAIDFGHSMFNKIGIVNSYGYSIILFTLLVKAATLPLVTTQLQSTTKMQKLAPLQQKINAKYPSKEEEQTKNQLLSQLFQAANVNPLAGCLPALVQIPIFISLYRALTNLVAENKLDEPFLWIPDLEGPIYTKPTAEAANWIKSIFTGTPELGWHDTIAFLSLPLILFVSQSVSMKILQPPRDPNRAMTEQEQFSQNILNYLPVIVAFFAINVPAGLSVYWIVNNALTTLITVAVKATIKDDGFPPEVERMMALIDSSSSSSAVLKKVSSASSALELQRKPMLLDDRPKVEGFGSSSTGSSLWNKPVGGQSSIPTSTITTIDHTPSTIGSIPTSNTFEGSIINDDDDHDDDEGVVKMEGSIAGSNDGSSSSSSSSERRKKRVKTTAKRTKKSRD